MSNKILRLGNYGKTEKTKCGLVSARRKRTKQTDGKGHSAQVFTLGVCGMDLFAGNADQ